MEKAQAPSSLLESGRPHHRMRHAELHAIPHRRGPKRAPTEKELLRDIEHIGISPALKAKIRKQHERIDEMYQKVHFENEKDGSEDMYGKDDDGPLSFVQIASKPRAVQQLDNDPKLQGLEATAKADLAKLAKEASADPADTTAADEQFAAEDAKVERMQNAMQAKLKETIADGAKLDKELAKEASADPPD